MTQSFEELIASLNKAERMRVTELIESLRSPCEEWINPNSDILDEAFSDEFRSRLLSQHSFQGSALFQDTFDQAFISALKAGGHEVGAAPDGVRFWDITLDGKRISLKSTKAKALSPDFLVISKLTEAAWIQDCRMASQRKERTAELFREFLEKVHRIFSCGISTVHHFMSWLKFQRIYSGKLKACIYVSTHPKVQPLVFRLDKFRPTLN